MVVLGKLVDSVSINPVFLYNQAVEVIYQEGVVTQLTCMYRHFLSKLHRPVKSHLLYRKYLLKVAQTVQYLARPG